MTNQSKLGLYQRIGDIGSVAAGRIRSNRFGMIVVLAVSLLSLICFGAIHYSRSVRSAFVFLDNVEARSLDARFQLRGAIPPDPNIVIAAIDQKTVDQLGWPFSRSHYARMLQTLHRDGARVVAFDVDFPFPDRSGNLDALSKLEDAYSQNRGATPHDPFLQKLNVLRAESDGDSQFAKSIEEAGNVVLGHLFFFNPSEIRDMPKERVQAYSEILAFQAYPQVLKRKSQQAFPFLLDAPGALGVEPNLRSFAEAAKSYGAFNFEADNDGTFRRAPLIFRYRDPSSESSDENFYPSLDVEAVRLFLASGPEQTKVWFNPTGIEAIELGNRQIRPDLSGRVLINYSGPAGTYPYYSLVDIASGALPPGAYKGKIVIVGATAIGIGDARPTPFAKQGYPGVEIHANVIDNLLHEHLLKRGFSEEMTDLWVLLLCGLLMGVVFVITPPLTATVFFFGSAFALGGFVYYGFSVDGRWLSFVLPGTTLAMNYLGVISCRVLIEDREKRKVRRAFGQYVSPGHIARMLKDPGRLQLGGEQAELTVMFSDIRGFTGIAEKLSPKELVSLLSEYLTAMTDIVFQHRGTLDKYIGDAVMAFWGRPFLDLPEHAASACRSALLMQESLNQLNRKWEREKRPTLRVGIGINTGLMMVGNMGSLRRFNYTVMGDHVNLASRIEGLTKEYGVQIIISESTLRQIGSEFVVRELDLIRVKGKTQPVAIYELLGPASDRAKYDELILGFHAGYAKYKAEEWAIAHEIFSSLTSQFPSDGPSKLFMERCAQFMREPPTDEWDGVFSMTHK